MSNLRYEAESLHRDDHCQLPMIDSIVAEVRKAREEFARQFNYDLHAMCEELRREEKLSGGGPLVSFPKRPVRTFPIKHTKEAALPAP
jgi:hypothetical protein